MPRKKLLVPTERVEFRLSANLMLQVDFFLARSFDGGVKLGERSKLVERLLQEWLNKQTAKPTTPQLES